MFASKSDECVIKTGVTVGEACKLLEVGFEYVTDVESVKLFRKQK